MRQQLQLLATVLLIIVAVIQWLVISERILASVWECYKFHGYGGSPGITVGVSTQILFYVLSNGFAITGLQLSRKHDGQHNLSAQEKLNRFCAIALFTGMALWSLVFISPLATFR
ncbi:MAG: hypothetical protein ACXWF8_18730 [Methylobacter sp.]